MIKKRRLFKRYKKNKMAKKKVQRREMKTHKIKLKKE